MQRLDTLERMWFRKKTPSLRVGDTVDVHVRIREGEKERVQLFTGTVIKQHGRGLSETFTVRRIVQGEGVERIFPLHAPCVVDVVVRKRGEVRRAKLYYLRDRIGRATKVRERLGEQTGEDAGAAPAAQAEPAAVPAAPSPEAGAPAGGKA
jgi:large subunit ribosomal protein L19